MKYIHLPLEGAYNVRDLGGYPTDKGVTPFNKFIRGDSLENLTKEDIQLLKDYGIKNIIDLRGDIEVKTEPDNITEDKDFNYKQMSLFGNVGNKNKDDLTKFVVDNPDKFLMDMYVIALEKAKSSIKNVLNYMTECDGGILFHCTGGKDRTGIISAILLYLVNVEKADIIANYEVTFTYLNENPKIKKQVEKYSEGLIHSKSTYIVNLLDYIDENYGNVEKYLEDIGMSKKNIKKLKEKLTEEI